jgi:predicted dehydrogenase
VDDSIINVAVVGCGMLAQSQHLPNIVRNPRMRLRACCDVSPTALDACSDQFAPERTVDDYRAIAEDPAIGLVVVATTERDRLGIIDALAAAGKSIYVEKPLANSPEELSAIERIVRGAGIPFCVGHNRRCAPAAIAAYETFRRHMETPNTLAWRFDRAGDSRPAMPDAAAAGVSIRINDDWFSWKAWAMDKRHAPHGPMLFEMTHFTDLCNWFMGSQPAEVVALEGGLLNHGVVIRYESGGIATIMMSAVGTFGYPKELYELMGNGGIVVVDHLLEVRTAGIAGEPPVRRFPMLNDRQPDVGAEGGVAGWLAKKRAACAEATATQNPLRQFTAEPDKGHSRALDAFVDEIRGAGPPVCDIDAAASATRVALAAAESVSSRRPVRISELA